MADRFMECPPVSPPSGPHVSILSGCRLKRNFLAAPHYEQNLSAFIKSLRKEFSAPNAKFVMAFLAQ